MDVPPVAVDSTAVIANEPAIHSSRVSTTPWEVGPPRRAHRDRQQKMASGLRLQSDPTRCKYPEDMPVGEERHIVLDAPHPLDHAIYASADLRGAFTRWTAVAKDHPVWRADVDLGRGQPLIVAVVPLAQARIGLGALREAGKLAGFSRTLHRARQHQPKTLLAEQGRQRIGQSSAVMLSVSGMSVRPVC